MFRSTYKNTVKAILRSALFWISLVVLVVLVAPAVSGNVSYNEGYEPPALDLILYQQHVYNLVASDFLVYALPVFAVIVTVLVLNRDYGDQFYEIEKAAGMKTAPYLLGRLCGIVSILLVVQLVLADILLHIYVIGCGGVEGLSLGAYLLDSTLRLISLTLAMSLPCVLFFVGLTYMVGTLFKSGVVGALAGFGYIIVFMALLFFKVTLVKMHNIKAAEVYYSYFSHIPDKLGHFCHAVGREDGQRIMAMMDTSFGEAAVALAMLLGLFVLFAAVICWRTKRRDV